MSQAVQEGCISHLIDHRHDSCSDNRTGQSIEIQLHEGSRGSEPPSSVDISGKSGCQASPRTSMSSHRPAKNFESVFWAISLAMPKIAA